MKSKVHKKRATCFQKQPKRMVLSGDPKKGAYFTKKQKQANIIFAYFMKTFWNIPLTEGNERNSFKLNSTN